MHTTFKNIWMHPTRAYVDRHMTAPVLSCVLHPYKIFRSPTWGCFTDAVCHLNGAPEAKMSDAALPCWEWYSLVWQMARQDAVSQHLKGVWGMALGSKKTNVNTIQFFMCFLPLKGLLTEHWRHQIVLFTFQHLTWTQTRQAGMLEMVNEGNAHSLVVACRRVS